MFGVDAAQRGEGHAFVGEASMEEDAALSTCFPRPLLQRLRVCEKGNVAFVQNTQHAFPLWATPSILFSNPTDVLNLVVRQPSDLLDGGEATEPNGISLWLASVEAEKQDCIFSIGQLLFQFYTFYHLIDSGKHVGEGITTTISIGNKIYERIFK